MNDSSSQAFLVTLLVIKFWCNDEDFLGLFWEALGDGLLKGVKSVKFVIPHITPLAMRLENHSSDLGGIIRAVYVEGERGLTASDRERVLLCSRTRSHATPATGSSKRPGLCQGEQQRWVKQGPHSRCAGRRMQGLLRREG